MIYSAAGISFYIERAKDVLTFHKSSLMKRSSITYPISKRESVIDKKNLFINLINT